MTWSVANYNANPALNTAINGVDISELCSAAGFNDALRQIMADIAAWTATGLATLGGLSAVYRDLPIVIKNASFTFADANRASLINYLGAAGIATIDPEATTPITPGGVYLVHNGGTGNLVLTPGAGVTLAKNGAFGSSTATLAIGGVGSLVYLDNDYWIFNGSGIT